MAVICSIDACDREAKGRGWCKLHWARWRKNGHPLRLKGRRTPLETRLWRRVDKNGEGGCWLWTGALGSHGYATIGLGGDGCDEVYVHRLVYQLLVGPIPSGYHIDHLCRVRSCCNPVHLEAVTPAENIRRAAPTIITNRCLRGHEFAGGNLYVSPDGRRICRECSRIRKRAWKAARRWETDQDRRAER